MLRVSLFSLRHNFCRSYAFTNLDPSDQFLQNPIYPSFRYPLTPFRTPRNGYEKKAARIKRSKDLLAINGFENKLKYIRSLKADGQYWQSTIMPKWNTSLDILEFIQFLTKTYVDQSTLLYYYDKYSKIKELPQHSIIRAHKTFKNLLIYLYKGKALDQDVDAHISNIINNIIFGLSSLCINTCAPINSFLHQGIMEQNNEMTYTWFKGGYDYPLNQSRRYWIDEQANAFSYNKKLEYNIRNNHLLHQVVPIDSIIANGKVNDFNYPPSNFGICFSKKPFEILPGFLNEHDSRYYVTFQKFVGKRVKERESKVLADHLAKTDLKEIKPKAWFPYLSYHTTQEFNHVPGQRIYSSYDDECETNAKPLNQCQDIDEVLTHKAYALQPNGLHNPRVLEKITASALAYSFSWLNSLSHYLGFTHFNELTYPLVTQTICTDGKRWNFYTYQLNTNHLWMRDDPAHGRANPNLEENFDDIPEYDRDRDAYRAKIEDLNAGDDSVNPRRNVCWHSGEMKLFDQITPTEVIGYNPEVLETCLKFYSLLPNTKPDFPLTPYLENVSPDLIENYPYIY